ncbi:flocculation protein FLO11-like [Triticum aestivum]|uniref:flocculation protein FLO11-like n=1 Tax=Triticum aestivum TaxID=4565 RepID=UPI001D01E35F|nr:flocculation protein FLO11-like [Triticum aestivum]
MVTPNNLAGMIPRDQDLSFMAAPTDLVAGGHVASCYHDSPTMAAPHDLVTGGRVARCYDVLSSMAMPNDLVVGRRAMSTVQQDASTCYVMPQSSSTATDSRPVVPMLAKAPHPSRTLPVPVIMQLRSQQEQMVAGRQDIVLGSRTNSSTTATRQDTSNSFVMHSVRPPPAAATATCRSTTSPITEENMVLCKSTNMAMGESSCEPMTPRNKFTDDIDLSLLTLIKEKKIVQLRQSPSRRPRLATRGNQRRRPSSAYTAAPRSAVAGGPAARSRVAPKEGGGGAVSFPSPCQNPSPNPRSGRSRSTTAPPSPAPPPSSTPTALVPSLAGFGAAAAP